MAKKYVTVSAVLSGKIIDNKPEIVEWAVCYSSYRDPQIEINNVPYRCICYGEITEPVEFKTNVVRARNSITYYGLTTDPLNTLNCVKWTQIKQNTMSCLDYFHMGYKIKK